MPCECTTAGELSCTTRCERRESWCRSTTLPVHWHPVFADLGYRRGICPRAEQFYAQQLSLPLFPEMTGNDVERVASAVRAFFGQP